MIDRRWLIACQSLGLNSAPVCLAAGDETGPTQGEPGCHPVYNPCQEGSTCIDVVCRKLCFPGEPDLCAPGESCVSIAQRTDIAYCLAN